MREYRMRRDSVQWRFHESRASIQVFGGGYANGKTAAACVKALRIAREYPGASVLVARSTYPKLNDTIRKEFLRWCPRDWIKRRPTKDDNTLALENGTEVAFRYVAQQGKMTQETSASNLLSATYDVIAVDQMEDPEFSYKDFLDLIGRLRGSTPYQGDDPTMPRSGPRFFMITANPTSNWFYKKVVRPVHRQAMGIDDPDLIRDESGKVLIEVFEGSTYVNKDNLPEDYLRMLEASYHGQMRDRYLLGKWASYEGLVYPDFDESTHIISAEQVRGYFDDLLDKHVKPTIIEGYDHGIAAPACYLLGFVDFLGNIVVADGFYEKGLRVDRVAAKIGEIRSAWGVDSEAVVLCDPSIFRRSNATVGPTVAAMLGDHGIGVDRGNNDIINGIGKVGGYLFRDPSHSNPVTGDCPAPRLYFSDALPFVANEFGSYYWRKNAVSGETEDKPHDRDDHAMDCLKYMLSDQPLVGKYVRKAVKLPDQLMVWRETAMEQTTKRRPRHMAA